MRIETFRRGDFHLETLAVQFAVDPWLLSNVEMKAMEHHVSRTLIYGLRKRCLSREVETINRTFTFPVNWWEHLKLNHPNWFPAWYRKRHPVKMREEVVVERTIHICPHSTIPFDSKHQHIHFEWLVNKED